MIEVAELTVKPVALVAPNLTAVTPGEVGAGDGDGCTARLAGRLLARSKSRSDWRYR